jgi:hypothetical protein
MALANPSVMWFGILHANHTGGRPLPELCDIRRHIGRSDRDLIVSFRLAGHFTTEIMYPALDRQNEPVLEISSNVVPKRTSIPIAANMLKTNASLKSNLLDVKSLNWSRKDVEGEQLKHH